MSTCEENDELINIFILISDIKEDLKKLKSLDIPTDEIQITELKVNSLSAFIYTQNPYKIKIIQDIVDATLVKNAELKILLREASGIEMSQRKLSLIDDQEGVPVSDISIRFFGIEWPSVLRRWHILERKTRSVFYFIR